MSMSLNSKLCKNNALLSARVILRVNRFPVCSSRVSRVFQFPLSSTGPGPEPPTTDSPGCSCSLLSDLRPGPGPGPCNCNNPNDKLTNQQKNPHFQRERPFLYLTTSTHDPIFKNNQHLDADARCTSLGPPIALVRGCLYCGMLLFSHAV